MFHLYIAAPLFFLKVGSMCILGSSHYSYDIRMRKCWNIPCPLAHLGSKMFLIVCLLLFLLESPAVILTLGSVVLLQGLQKSSDFIMPHLSPCQYYQSLQTSSTSSIQARSRQLTSKLLPLWWDHITSQGATGSSVMQEYYILFTFIGTASNSEKLNHISSSA